MSPTIVWIRDGVGFTPPAASAFVRANTQVRDEFGRDIDVNSTYRDWDTQLAWHLASVAYKNGRGPYPGHSWAVHPSESFHVAGTALDSDDWVHARIVEILADNGFIRNRLHVPGEQHHFEYIQARDKFYGQPAGIALEEDDMFTDEDRKMLREAHDAALWSKKRIGGTSSGVTIAEALGKILTVAEWIKTRVGGTTIGKFQTVTDILGRIVKKTGS